MNVSMKTIYNRKFVTNETGNAVGYFLDKSDKITQKNNSSVKSAGTMKYRCAVFGYAAKHSYRL